MEATVIDLLEREWRVLVGSPAAAESLVRWRGDDALARFHTLAELVEHVARRSTPVGERDRVLVALAMRASDDDLAARTVLQLLLPGCKALIGRFRWSAESADELAAEIVSDLYDRIRAFAGRRARSYVAATLLNGTKKRLVRQGSDRERPTCLEDEAQALELAEPAAVPAAADELAELLAWAVSAGHLDAGEAELISLTRTGELSVATLCPPGPAAATLRQRRRRAELRLVAAVHAA
ncbi:MAG TPA: hypothetical protein VFJ85_01155 [Acidimicrobiales bacterium]|nr:hypothetical protein [Acidimicrobiales bacterium]